MLTSCAIDQSHTLAKYCLRVQQYCVEGVRVMRGYRRMKNRKQIFRRNRNYPEVNETYTNTQWYGQQHSISQYRNFIRSWTNHFNMTETRFRDEWIGLFQTELDAITRFLLQFEVCLSQGVDDASSFLAVTPWNVINYDANMRRASVIVVPIFSWKDCRCNDWTVESVASCGRLFMQTTEFIYFLLLLVLNDVVLWCTLAKR